MNPRQARTLILGLFASLLIASCGASQSESTSTIPISTTTVVSDPTLALKNLAKSLNALDYSRISDSSCGKFSLVVAPERIHFYKFEVGAWKQVDEEFGSWRPPASILVTTRDYTNDGSADFLISFGKAVPVGAIFGQIDCQWQWFDIQSETGTISKTIEGLGWSDEREVLTGTDYGSNGTSSSVILNYDMHNSSFFTEPDVVEVVSNIPSTCQSGMDGAYILFGKEEQTYAYDTTTGSDAGMDDALRNCRRADWLTMANQRRSQYSNMDDYSYYGIPSVLLEGQDAKALLDDQCDFYWDRAKNGYTNSSGWGVKGIPYDDLRACQ